METLNGLILIDKPVGPTSHDIVNRVRRSLNIRAVGHAGTLDPFASGLLILGIGKGTKSLTALVGVDKVYEVEAKLGATTDTFDREGVIKEVVAADTIPPSQQRVEAVLKLFVGAIQQKAPLYSAIKLKGKKLYELARAGTATEDLRPVRDIVIHELTLLEYAWPTLKLRVHSSSGTYIRSLVDDIGATLGVGAYCQELRRTKIADYDVKNAIDGNTITAEKIDQALIRI